MPLIKNVSARLHILGDHRLSPGESREVDADFHAKVMASPAGRAREIVDADIPMPKPRPASIGSAPAPLAIRMIADTSDVATLDTWAGVDGLDESVKAAIANRKRDLAGVPAPPAPPPARFSRR